MKALKILIFGVVLCSMTTSCKDSIEKIQAKNEMVIENYFKLFNEHQWKELSEFYVENAEFKDPSFGNGIVKQSKAEFVKKYTELNQVFPDLKDKVIQVYPSGDKNIIVEFVSTGTAPDQSKFELPITTIFTIEDGKITKDYTYYNNFEEAK
ncbi:nuclear transport factor 2 family protein [Chryseobacterium sp. KACC 21268]|nr:nuclear transport factor 2 family protein [Chryseobacterium sp. KACC 21268]